MMRSSRCRDMVPKPPKPPCWRDFVCQTDSSALKELYFTNLQRLQKSGLPVIGAVGSEVGSESDQKQTDRAGPPETSAARSTKHGKRTRVRLHRTRSQVLIQEADLPNGSLAINLSDTKPSEFGLSSERRNVCDSRRVQEENTKRCRKWLATVEASQPLDDIAFALGPGVDVEVPEECWASWAERGPAICPDTDTLGRATCPVTDLRVHTASKETVRLDRCEKGSIHPQSLHKDPDIERNAMSSVHTSHVETLESAVR